jgi:hypothetical protein
MAQDITDDLGMCASVNLTCRVAVSKDVGADLRRDITCSPSIKADPMAERTGRECAMWQPFGDEDFAHYSVSRTAMLEIRGKGFRNGRQKW